MLGLKGRIVNFVVRRIKNGAQVHISSTVCFLDALRQGRKFTIQPFQSSLDDTIALQYTGGTTGVSKGTMLTNRNLLANMMQIRAWLMPVLHGQEGESARVYALCRFTISFPLR